MTKEDLANLVVRAIALWLGATAALGVATIPWVPAAAQSEGGIATALASVVPFLAGVILWVSAPVLARTMFRNGSEEVPLVLRSADVPHAASFVVGLWTLAGAIPQVAAWIGVQIMRSRTDPSVFGSSSALRRSIDEQGIATGLRLLAQVVVGVALIANSRRIAMSWRGAGKSDDVALEE